MMIARVKFEDGTFGLLVSIVREESDAHVVLPFASSEAASYAFLRLTTGSMPQTIATTWLGAAKPLPENMH